MIGIFGGTFDPLHVGHLRAAEEVRESYGLQRVYFVPALTPPHKRAQRVSDALDRMAMVRMAVRGNMNFRVSDMEVKRGGVSYTLDTLNAFRRKSPQLYFLIGMDAFMELDTWHRYEEVFSRTNFVVMVRPILEQKTPAGLFPVAVRDAVRQIDHSTFEHRSGKKTHLHRVTQLDISSTGIRERVRSGRSIRYLVPALVEKYIGERGLYGA